MQTKIKFVMQMIFIVTGLSFYTEFQKTAK